jgi:sortase A
MVVYDSEDQPATALPALFSHLNPSPTPILPVVIDQRAELKPDLETALPTPVQTEKELVFSPQDNISPFQLIQADRAMKASQGGVPVRLQIPTIGLDVPVLPATWRKVLYEGYVFDQWKAPKDAAGWQADSALLGKVGNTVINGHNNEYGEVFRYLENVKPGDIINTFSMDGEFTYIVTNRMILLEEGEKSAVRLENASWIAKTSDERLTLVTCWPYDTNTHRLIVVASPVHMIRGN